jgi:hypothetical protein
VIISKAPAEQRDDLLVLLSELGINKIEPAPSCFAYLR